MHDVTLAGCSFLPNVSSGSPDSLQVLRPDRETETHETLIPCLFMKAPAVLLNSLLFLVQLVERPKTQTIQLVWESVCICVAMCLYERDGRGKEANKH